MVVTVARGHTDEARRVFVTGEPSPALSVGSRGDWCVSGPGVVPVHLWLSFDGRQLLAASGEATVHHQGRPLGSELSPVRVGDELRFGFALLRVGLHELRPERARSRLAGSRGPWLLAAAAAAVLLLFIAGGLAISRRGTPAEPSARAEAATPPKLPEPAAPGPATPPAVAIDVPRDGEPAAATAAVAPVAAADDKPLGLLPPPPDEEQRAVPLLKPQAAFPQNVANRAVPRVGEQPWVISEAWKAQHERQLRLANRRTAKVVFLGDSITEGWGYAPAYKARFGKYSPLNLGIVGDTTQNVIWRVNNGALDGTQPGLVVVMIGINNLAGGFTAEATADGVRAVVSAAQTRLPSVRILLLAVLPARQEATNPLREKIRQANRLLAGLASPGKVELLDVGSVLLEPDGSISKAILRDFIHPTPEGFDKLTQAVAPRIEGVLGEGAAAQ
jgi:lysophospholipase L1-like esterase